MRDNLELLLQDVLKPQLAPPAELNLKILNEVKDSNIVSFNKRKAVSGIIKAAIILLAVGILATAGTYAATEVWRHFFISEIGITYGEMDDIELFKEADVNCYEPTVHDLLEDEGDETVKWYSKEVTQNDDTEVLNEYRYRNYADLAEDAMMDEWLDEEIIESAYMYSGILTVISSEGYYKELNTLIDACFNYKDGTFFISQEWMRGNNFDEDNFGWNLAISGACNVRTYTNINGRVFTLTDDEGGITYTTFFYPRMKMGDISFRNLEEEDIYYILDHFVEPHVPDADFIYPEKPGVEPITVPWDNEKVEEVEESRLEPVELYGDIIYGLDYVHDDIVKDYDEKTTVTISEDSVFDSEFWELTSPNLDIVIEKDAHLIVRGLLDIAGTITYEPGSLLCDDEGQFYLTSGSALQRGKLRAEVECRTNENVVNGYAAVFGIQDEGKDEFSIWGGPGCTIKFSGVSLEELENTVIFNNLHRDTIVMLDGKDVTKQISVEEYLE